MVKEIRYLVSYERDDSVILNGMGVYVYDEECEDCIPHVHLVSIDEAVDAEISIIDWSILRINKGILASESYDCFMAWLIRNDQILSAQSHKEKIYSFWDRRNKHCNLAEYMLQHPSVEFKDEMTLQYAKSRTYALYDEIEGLDGIGVKVEYVGKNDVMPYVRLIGDGFDFTVQLEEFKCIGQLEGKASLSAYDRFLRWLHDDVAYAQFLYAAWNEFNLIDSINAYYKKHGEPVNDSLLKDFIALTEGYDYGYIEPYEKPEYQETEIVFDSEDVQVSVEINKSVDCPPYCNVASKKLACMFAVSLVDWIVLNGTPNEECLADFRAWLDLSFECIEGRCTNRTKLLHCYDAHNPHGSSVQSYCDRHNIEDADAETVNYLKQCKRWEEQL